jgi:glycosyltransferase involved in cell wall biosynthesis
VTVRHRAVGRVAFVLKGYPRLSETFIAQEILALERLGLEILIVSLRHPTDHTIHPVHRQIRAALLYLPEYLHREIVRVWRGWHRCRRSSSYRAARAAWLRDLRRNPSLNRIRRFGQALVLAAELPHDVERIHAHFLHTPSSVARYAALLTGLEWSASAHARDIWTSPEWDKRVKLAEARWIVTCTEVARDHLQRLAPGSDAVWLCYHGLDLARFAPPPRPRARYNGSDPQRPVIILSVGRMVAKKGYDDLLKALALLPRCLCWRFVHIGGGPLAGTLRLDVERFRIRDRVEWRGARPQPEVLAAYRQADIFVLACKIAEDGDQDGLPNVLVEAQSQQLPCVATDLSAIPELIEPEVNGLLVPPGDPIALALQLERLIRDPEERARLGGAGERRVRSVFSMEAGVRQLASRFGLVSETSDGGSLDAPAFATLRGAAIRRRTAEMECVSPSMPH